MKEPQVERFCSCIKKVKKTLKGNREGRAIAICTKSVLQSRGRTLKKVKCRDGILETQPMKGGVLFAMGADTPVFYDEGFTKYPSIHGIPDTEADVDEMNKNLLAQYPVPKGSNESLLEMIKTYRPVVRLVPENGEEMPIHRTIKNWFVQNTGPYLDSYVKMHTNVFVGLYPVNIKETYERVEKDNPNRDKIGLATFNGSDKNPWFGLIACHQRSNVYNLPNKERIAAIGDILTTLRHIDGRFIHYDLHMSNAAVMDDGTVVIHDFGRSKIRDYLQKHTSYRVSYPKNWNVRVFRVEHVHKLVDETEYNLKYGQFFYIARYFDKEKHSIPNLKAWLDTSSYDPEHPENNLIIDRNQQLIKEDGRINLYEVKDVLDYDEAKKAEKTVAWSEAQTYYLEPKYETRYHQLARIFDILAVLKPLHDYTSNGAQFTEASRAAKELLMSIHTTPPTASAQLVRQILVTRKLIKDTTMAENIVQADEYWKTANKPRNGGKSKAELAIDTAAPPSTPQPITGGAEGWDTDDGGPPLLEPKSDPKKRMTTEQLEKEAAESVPKVDMKSGRRTLKGTLPQLV
jgi:hypothetical protein